MDNSNIQQEEQQATPTPSEPMADTATESAPMGTDENSHPATTGKMTDGETTIPDASTSPVIGVADSPVVMHEENHATIMNGFNAPNVGVPPQSHDPNVMATVAQEQPTPPPSETPVPAPDTSNSVNGLWEPRQAASALGNNVVSPTEQVGGPDNAFMKSPPPPDAFLKGPAPEEAPLPQQQQEEEAYDDDAHMQDIDVNESNSWPLGIPHPDDEESNQHHSLPNPEELKTSTSFQSTSNKCNCLKYPKLFFFVLFLVIFVIILAVPLALTKDQRAQNKATVFHGGDQRLFHMQEYLIANGISSSRDFQNKRTPQYQALDWLAHDDEFEIGIPMLTPGASEEAYDFVTRYVMAVLYYATTGKSWQHDLSFLSKKKTCDWYQVFAPPVGQVGVLCNQSSRKVVGISFISNNLVGSLPSELSQLTTLTYMESIGNAISGTIPSQIQSLTNLQTLVLAFNMLTGSIPKWVEKLKNMEFFYLSNNMFTGTIPQSLLQLPKLNVLALDDNNLRGSADLVWKLSNLEYLYLEDNDFTGTMPEILTENQPLFVNLDISTNRLSGPLPKDLFRLSRMEILDVHGNSFTGEIPRDINADHENLRFVALHDNNLSGSIPATIGNLMQLTHLDVSNNTLTGRIPLEMEHLTELVFLFLGGNGYIKENIPSWIYSMNKLKELSLKSAKLTGTISELIGALDKLVLLDLDDNELTGSIPNDIGMLTALQYLLLNRNELSEVIPASLEKLTDLRFLLLDSNHLLGDLTDVCSSMNSLTKAYVDCGEVFCPDECCSCCFDDEICHSYDAISSVDPVWETGYQRQFFDFSSGVAEPFSATDDDVVVPPP